VGVKHDLLLNLHSPSDVVGIDDVGGRHSRWRAGRGNQDRGVVEKGYSRCVEFVRWQEDTVARQGENHTSTGRLVPLLSGHRWQ